VTVLTNSLAATDVAAVHAGYQRYRKPLLEADVQLYELKPAATGSGTADRKKSVFGSSKSSLHAKTYVFGRKGVFIGSMNFDPRSVELNTEKSLAKQLAGACSPSQTQALRGEHGLHSRLAGCVGQCRDSACSIVPWD
jgi:hypothetical protein